MTFTTAAEPRAGESAISWLGLTYWTEVADVPPNVTAELAVKSVPLMVTAVPPPNDPASGVRPVTVGALT